jgi:hypothetical protein
VGVDEPDRILLGPGREIGFLAGERARHQGLQRLAQALLDLAVDRRVAAPAARPLGAQELGGEALALRLDRGDHGSEQILQSKTLPRSAFTRACRFLDSSLRIFEDFVGRVGLRFLGRCAAAATSDCRRASASARLRSRLRCCCALMTTTPVRVTRWSPMRSSRSFTSSGSDEARMS